jgi:hypothetical protein
MTDIFKEARASKLSAWTTVKVQMKNLPGACCHRWLAFDTKKTGRLPQSAAGSMNSLKEGFAYVIHIHSTDRGIDSKGNPGLGINLVLEKLIARGPATESTWQHFFENTNQVGIP